MLLFPCVGTSMVHIEDIRLLNLIQAYFGGSGYIKTKKDRAEFRVTSLKQITSKILPHFDMYSLRTKKQLGDYILFREIIEIKNRQEDFKEIVNTVVTLNKLRLASVLAGFPETKVKRPFIEMKNRKEGDLQKIVNTVATLNKQGLPSELKAAFPETEKVKRSFIENQQLPDPQWFVGFASTKGSFSIEIRDAMDLPIPIFKVIWCLDPVVLLRFQLTLYRRDQELINSIISYFECGRLERDEIDGKKVCYYVVSNFSDIKKKLIPLFKKCPIMINKKYLDFKYWCRAALNIETGTHLSKRGLNELKEIKAGMYNKGRY